MFIKLHYESGQPVLINPDNIFCIEPTNPNGLNAGKTVITYPGDQNGYTIVTESYKEIESLLEEITHVY